ncbi:MAG: tRNA lysidine(34) synthetase TilS [bacterium]|nr:tRNA lysidine(34) synthetase TilS [bacterium]
MDPLHTRIAAFLREYEVPRAARMLVAASGGGDSMALLHVLVALGQSVEVAHVHHGLRGAEADEDLEFVRLRAGQLGLPFRCQRVDAATRDKRSPEARARELRYQALEEMREAFGLDWIATAHTLDDQAETVLLRAIRGTGLAGLASIRPRAARVLRPALEARRSDLRDYLKVRGLSWREDSSNADLAVPRNRLRIEALRVLEEIHSGAALKLAQLAAIAAREEASGAAEMDDLARRALEVGEGGLWVDPAALRTLGANPRRAVWADALRRVGLSDRVSTLHLERIDSFIAGEGGRRLSLPRDFSLFRDRDRVWLGPGTEPVFSSLDATRIRPPGALEFSQQALRLTCHREPVDSRPEDGLRVADEVIGSLRIRSPRPGDAMRGAGDGRSRIEDMFDRARWSRRRCGRALLVELDREVVWVPGLISFGQVGREACPGWQLVAQRLSAPGENC